MTAQQAGGYADNSFDAAAPFVGLTELLRSRLSQVDELTNSTWADRLIEVWIDQALKGNFRALQEILARTEGDRSRQEVEGGDQIRIGERTAIKILEALCEDNDDLPRD